MTGPKIAVVEVGGGTRERPGGRLGAVYYGVWAVRTS